ncbi:MAG: CHASE2 domain-containing protein [Lachnospiraceae bacterium]|nr:CHASE2 domain-containing protein [Lachnospiraceae bacterium]
MRKVKQYLPILAVVLLTCAVIGAGGLRRMDRWVQDELFQHPGTPSADIVIIGIDEKALELFGTYYTWDRNIIASALEALAADPDKRPAAVAADVLYSGDTTPEAGRPSGAGGGSAGVCGLGFHGSVR